MKIIHCADLHLDSKMDAFTSEKSKKRREETLSTFERLCNYAEENGVSGIIIAGDMFDTERVLVKTKERVIRAIINAKNVNFYYLSGNHDDKSFLLETELPSNFNIFSNTWTTYDLDGVKISGIIVDNKNALNFYDSLNLDKNDVNIVTLHGQIAGYKSKDNAEIISLPRLKEKNIDYLALGHIHECGIEKLDNRTVYAYSGCLEGRGFDETGEKGFILLNIEDKKITPEFVPFAVRNLYEYEFNVEGFDSFYDAAESLITILKEKYSPKSLIKVVLKGAHKTDFIVDKNKLAEELNALFFFAKVYDKTELSVSLSDYENDKSVLGEFVRSVLESPLDSSEKSKVIMCGINALKGEEI